MQVFSTNVKRCLLIQVTLCQHIKMILKKIIVSEIKDLFEIIHSQDLWSILLLWSLHSVLTLTWKTDDWSIKETWSHFRWTDTLVQPPVTMLWMSNFQSSLFWLDCKPGFLICKFWNNWNYKELFFICVENDKFQEVKDLISKRQL